jgi:hypothetical protein
MKEVLILILACSLIISCSHEEITPEEHDLDRCSTPATIRDYRGLDGCGYVLELNDGTILESVSLIVCGPPPQSIMTLDDPLLNYHIDGLKVLIDYENYAGGSVCMVGELVRITCITKAESSSSDE